MDQTLSKKEDRLYVKAVLADFDRADLLEMVLRRARPERCRLFGHSFMSLAEEPERLNAVKSKMSGDDLLVIEAPLESHGIPLDQDSSDAELSFYFGPLRSPA